MVFDLRAAYRSLVPASLRTRYGYRYLRQGLQNLNLMREYGVDRIKYARELHYWKARHAAEGGVLKNHWYEKIFLAMAEQPNANFLSGQVVADFGCGPRGSLLWAKAAKARIGIDVLVDVYAELGIKAHDMIYVRSSENEIPLPTGSVDVLLTLNALDHVDRLEVMCDELLRVLAPGGLFLGSFNLYEPRSFAEPQTLTPELLDRVLLSKLALDSYRLAPRGPAENVYLPMLAGTPVPDGEQPGLLWVRGKKPS
jgi:SAM-dependent methyltransferase